MTDSTRGSLGPPWSVDLLADLHAGLLDPGESARLWPQVEADPEARAVLAALDSVTGDLGRLGQAPAEPMPAMFAARLDAALAAEAQRAGGPVATRAAPTSAPAPPPPVPPAAPVIDLAAARRRRNRMAAWGAGVLTAAAAVAAFAFIALPGGGSTDGSPVAGGGNTAATETGQEPSAPLALTSENPGAAIGLLSGRKDYGDLGDEYGLRECLSAHDVPAGDTIGVSPVTFDGADAVAALLGAGTEQGRFRLVVLEPTCTAENPGRVLADTQIPN